MIELINEYQLQQLITSPTTITPRTKTLLDIIITKIGDTKIIESGVIHLGISDHSLVYACRKVSIPKAKPKVVETRQFKHFNITNFQQDLNQALNSILFYNCTDANTAWYTWKEIFLEIADIHAPVLKRKVKSEYNPWMTNEIKNMSYHRDFLKRKAIKHNSTRYHELYKNCRNRVNNLITIIIIITIRFILRINQWKYIFKCALQELKEQHYIHILKILIYNIYQRNLWSKLQAKAFLNKNVFKDFLKMSMEALIRSEPGNAFHNLGAAYTKALSPNVA